MVEENFETTDDKKRRDMMSMFFAQGVSKDEAISEAVLQALVFLNTAYLVSFSNGSCIVWPVPIL